MVWWLPTTWWENLGSSRRISRYKKECLGLDASNRLDLDGNPFFHYRVSAELLLEDGSTVTEHLKGRDTPQIYGLSHRMPSASMERDNEPSRGYSPLIRRFRVKMREIYPK